MKLAILNPKKALNKAFLKVKPNRKEIETFKVQLIALLDHANDAESEEFHKNLAADFLKNTYYAPQHFINTKGRADLVIHHGENANSPVGVIIETKKPTNTTEMLKPHDPNVKAVHELLLYYLRERFTLKNLEITYLIATNLYEWFLFDATAFEKICTHNKRLVKQFQDFEAGRLAGTTTEFISYLYMRLSSIANKDDFRQTTLGELRKLPIPIVDHSKQIPIICFVEKVLVAKRQDPQADTTALEGEIDRLVYALYGLSAEEIALVEGNT